MWIILRDSRHIQLAKFIAFHEDADFPFKVKIFSARREKSRKLSKWVCIFMFVLALDIGLGTVAYLEQHVSEALASVVQEGQFIGVVKTTVVLSMGMTCIVELVPPDHVTELFKTEHIRCSPLFAELLKTWPLPERPNML